MPAAGKLRVRSDGRWLIALLFAASASACATATTPAPKAKPKPTPVTAREPEPEPVSVPVAVVPPAPIPSDCETAKSATPARDGLVWPVDGVVIAAYGKREGSPHDGIDIAAPIGTPIHASKTGEVLYSGERPGYGRMVILGHDGGMVTIYAHNDENCVDQGERVTQGEVIALVGTSGGATSPGVHFEIRLGNKPVNPRAHLPK